MKRNYFIYTVLLAFIVLISACKKDDPILEGTVVAEFSYSADDGYAAPATITFTNESVIPEWVESYTYNWDFGDGSSSIEENPQHTFETFGNYTVTLTVTADGENTVAEEDLTIEKAIYFYEDFETITAFSNDWVILDEDGGTPNDEIFENGTGSGSYWIITNSSRFGSNIVVATSYFIDDPYPDANDWMITPGILVETGAYLSWDAMSLTSSGNYLDDYVVYISTTTQDITGCTNEVITVTGEEASTEATNPGAGVQHYEFDLAAYVGETIYIAFRLNTPDPGGDELGIDNIKVFEK